VRRSFFASASLIGIALLASGVARAQQSAASAAEPPSLVPPSEAVVETRSATWPLMLDVHALIGVEPHGRGSPVAFGAGAELEWRGRLGGFAELLSSEGTPIIAPTINGVRQQSFGDRISVPFGLAARPLAPWFIDRGDWWSRLASGIGAQVGITVEHVRTSDDSDTTAGLHLGLTADVPLWGSPRRGGVALRLYGRLMVTPSISLDFDNSTHAFTVFHPVATGQFYAGLAYYP
jgi:hypothetical protein